MAKNVSEHAQFIAKAIRELAGEYGAPPKVLDFGCGSGELVDALRNAGLEAYGCDMEPYWVGRATHSVFESISTNPYRLPFNDGEFDVVVSTSVLEHAQNKEECFRELHRVMKRGGWSMHLFPAKWYLPLEPHIYVPLINHLWPMTPKWWFSLWALIGIRNQSQKGMHWREVAAANHRFARESLSYWSTRQYRDLSLRVFGNCRWLMDFYVEHSPGGFSRALRRLPGKKWSGVISREFRYAFLVLEKKEMPT